MQTKNTPRRGSREIRPRRHTPTRRTYPTAAQIKEDKIKDAAELIADFLDPRNMSRAPQIIRDLFACFASDVMNELDMSLMMDGDAGEEIHRERMAAFLRHAERVGLRLSHGGFYREGRRTP